VGDLDPLEESVQVLQHPELGQLQWDYMAGPQKAF